MDDWLMDYVMLDAFDEEIRFANFGGGGGGSSYLFETIYFDGKQIAETEKAYLINSEDFNNVNVWVPKSQIEHHKDTEDGLTAFGIPRWLYDKKVDEGKNEIATVTKYTTVECNVMAQSALAWLLKLDGVEFWVPTSQMKSRKFDRTKSKWVIELSEWILNKNMKKTEDQEEENEQSSEEYCKIICENSSIPFMLHKKLGC
jgi:hypothetical protein